MACTCGPALFAQLLTPSEFLPHEHGEQFTPHHLLVDYFQTIAEESNRVRLEEYGRTNEGRPLLLTFVSTPENLAQLEAIRTNNLRRAGLLDGATDPKLDDVAIVWLSYSVHGNEAAGSEASMGVLYDLANPANRLTSDWLKNTLVIIDPAVNPDGYNRYTNWYRQTATRNVSPDPAVREHDEPWPGGRVNHYLFDLNRDWAWQTQVESRQRMVRYLQWMPHIHADLHEQGYTDHYYFAPAARPFHEYITDWQGDFQTEIGRNHAKYFDKEGWLYFTRERFDLLYPSYGDTYPTFNGAIGMTYEQAGHSRAGRAIDLPNGDTLSLADRIAHHTATSLSTVEIASREARRLVANFGDYFKQAVTSPQGKYASYVISADTPPGKLRRLRELLDRNGIRYHRLKSARNVKGYGYQDGKEEDSRFAAGALVVPARQPRSVLAQVLFDPDVQVEDSVTYDITAWSVPLAYGLTATATTTAIGAGDLEDFPAQPPLREVTATDPATLYSYVAPWEDLTSAQFLADLLQAGIQVRTAGGAFQFGDRQFPPGSLLINRGDNRVVNDFLPTVLRLARKHDVTLTPLTTGFSTGSGGDLGGSNYGLVSAPKIATLSGEGVRANEFGQVWHFFERELEYPLSIFYTTKLEAVLEGNYDILVLAEGRYRMSDDQRSALRKWVRDGGKLIAVGSANGSLADEEGFGLKTKKAKEEELSDDEKREKLLLPYGGSERRFIEGFIPGAVVATEMDATHPLSFGIGARYQSLKVDDTAYAYLEDGWNVGRIRDGAVVRGFVGNKAYDKIVESLSFGVEPMGSGQVIYLVDNPLFRSFWEEGKFLFANALFQVR